ncbi:MAG: hypothetical protein KAJ19_23145 [Gammaproteobacteria bacterium]|nr:hypothetical protein [Gammaproteobacteria bacterium]
MSSKKSDKEERDQLKARGKFPSEMLKWVTNPEQEITQELNKFLDTVLKDRRRRIEVFLTALARKHVERAVFFVGRLPEIEAELLDPDRIKTMKNSDLIRLLGIISDQVEDASKYLLNFVTSDELRSEPLPSPGAEFEGGEKEVVVEDVSEEERRAAAELPPESRQKLGGILTKVLKAIETADNNQKPMLPAPPKSGEVEGKVSKKPKATKKAKAKKKSKGGS